MGQDIGNRGPPGMGHALPMDGRNELGRHLLTLRSETGMTQQDVADAVGISNTDLSRWENGLRVPQRHAAVESLVRLAQFYGERPIVLLRLAGLEPKGDEGKWPTMADIVRRHPDLTDKQRRALLVMMDSWPSTGPNPPRRE